MGLTIHYQLQAKRLSAARARTVIERLAERAGELGLGVGELVELPADEPGDGDDERSVKVGRDEYISVQPAIGFAVIVQPGVGCESASFGLAKHPPRIRFCGRWVATKLSGWSWRAFCKTQFAGNPRLGGLENFLRCHLGLIALLDFARELGVLKEVVDEGGYWQHRDRQMLVREVGQWDELIAAIGGALKDAHGDVEAPIFAYPNFEPLEARGQKYVRDRRLK